VGKETLVHDLEPESLEKRGPVRQDKDLLDPHASGFLQQGFNELASYPLSLIGGSDSEGPDFRQIFPHNMKSATPDYLAGLFLYCYEEIPDLRVQLAHGTRQNVTRLRLFRDQPVN